MPTGYTADIAKGINFATFAMNCARAFGACVTIRDDPGGGEAIPDQFEPDTYHADAVVAAEGRLAELLKMTDPEKERAAAEAWDKAESHRVMRIAELRKLRAEYESMRAQVAAWRPPTPDHEGLKEFMLSQLDQSIDFDCDERFYSTPEQRMSGPEWHAYEVEDVRRSIETHSRQHAAEVQRAASRTAWVKALRASL